LSEQIDKLLAEESARWTEVLKNGAERDMAAFAEWSRKSPQHMRHFLMMTALDRELSTLDPQRKLTLPPAVQTDEATITPLRERVDGVASVRPATFHRSRRRWAIAAALGSLVALLTLFQFVPDRFSGWREFSTAQGEQRAVELADGSIMHLNTQSSIRVRFSEQGRDIRLLEGEALFKVAKDQTRPFRVHTSDLLIQALGTQFNVYTQGSGTKVSVLEGLVQITPNMPATSGLPVRPERLKAGQEAQVDAHGAVDLHPATDIAAVIAWRQRRLIFNQDPLSEVVTEFNRYNRAPQFRIQDPEVGIRPYSGAFDADDPESLIQLLGDDKSLELVPQGAEIVIRRR
jgi:transmembrane sensor